MRRKAASGRRRRRVAAFIVLLVSGCASTPTNFPIRTDVDGQRGFSMQGTLKYTGDPAVTRARIERAFAGACGGPAEITQLNMNRRGATGLKFYNYDAVARCISAPSPDHANSVGGRR